MLISSPFNRKVKVRDAEFTLGVSFGAKLEFMRCQKINSSGEVEYDMAKILEAVHTNRVVLDWDNINTTNDSGEVVPVKFSREAFGNLDLSIQMDVALEALNIAFGEVPNEQSSESR